MLKYCAALPHELIRAQRDCHLNVVDIPLLPRTPVQPHITVFQPGLAFEAINCLIDGRETNTVCAVWIRQVACRIDLMRFYLLHQVDYYFDVLLTQRFLLNCTGLIKWHVKEVRKLISNPSTAATCFCLSSPDQSFDR